MRAFLTLAMFFCAILSGLGQGRINIIPRPDSIVEKAGEFIVTGRETITGPEQFREARELLHAALQERALREPVAPGRKIMFQLAKGKKEDSAAYTLSITSSAVTITASHKAGALHAVRSLTQLTYTNKGKLPCAFIKDKPRFGYRGLMLDVSRNFYPVSYVKKLIDLLSLYKLNTLHLHLTDAAGWRLQIRKYPELTGKAAWRTKDTWKEWWKSGDRQYSTEGEPTAYGGYYTREDAKALVSYAAKRGINIVPEIEMPGHSEEVLETYPHLKCANNTGVQGEFCLGNDSTFIFLQDVFTEVMEIFPSQLIHLGGDEASRKNWKTCPRCQQRMKDNNLKNEDELQSYAVKRLEQFISSKGRTAVGWDEILEGGLAPGATVMSWRGEKGGIEAAKQDHDVIMSPVNYCYFDYYQQEPSTQPEAIGGFLPLQKVYSYDPVPAELPADKQQYIKGLQGNVWTEYISTQEHLDHMIFPRVIALAEVGWTGKDKKNWEDFKARMQKHYSMLQMMDVDYCRPSDKVDVSIQMLPGEAKVDFNTEQHMPEIRYTLDGSTPSATSPVYSGPFDISSSAVIKASIFRSGRPAKQYDSLEVDFHKALNKPVKYINNFSSSYPAQKETTLVNGYRGGLSYHDGQWQGFLKDLEVIIDLQDTISVSEVRSTFMQITGPGVYLPDYVEVSFSLDGNSFIPAGKTLNTVSPNDPNLLFHKFTVNTKGERARFVKFFAKKHSGFLFADEIIVY